MGFGAPILKKKQTVCEQARMPRNFLACVLRKKGRSQSSFFMDPIFLDLLKNRKLQPKQKFTSFSIADMTTTEFKKTKKIQI